MWKFVEIRGKMTTLWNDLWKLKIDEACRLVPRQGENRSVCIGADAFLLELLIEALHSPLRRVVVFAEVAEHNVFDARMINFSQETRRLHIAQMTKRPSDTLFQYVRIGAFFQHIRVVIGLDDKVCRLADLFFHYFVKHSDVGGDGQSMSFKIKMIAYCATSIVHDRKRLNGDAEQFKRLQRFDFVEQGRVYLFGGFALYETLQAIRMGVNRYGTILCESLQAQNVVNMVVGDKYGFDTLRRQVLLLQLLFQLFRADAHVDEQSLFLTAHIIAIAATTRGKAAKDERRKA